MSRWRLAALAVVLAAAALTAVVAAQEREARLAEGKRLFTEHGCYGCHTVGRYGTGIGPDLSHIGSKHTEGYLEQWLSDPRTQKPTAHMPRIELMPVEIKALAVYLASLR
jgi:mono/diheme cytochrome c family protein